MIDNFNEDVEKELALMQKFPILRYFDYAHLSEHLKARSKPFEEIAWIVAMDKENNNPAEVATCLRKLLEAKDCAVRAVLP